MHSSRHLSFEDTRRIMSPEMRLKSFGTFQKQAPDCYQLAWYLIKHMKKFLHFDWLRALQFFSKTVQKRVNSVQKEETNQAFWLVNDQRNLQMAIKSFVFKSSARPGWRNWWRNISLIAWYTCVSSVLPFRNFFMHIINK